MGYQLSQSGEYAAFAGVVFKRRGSAFQRLDALVHYRFDSHEPIEVTTRRYLSEFDEGARTAPPLDDARYVVRGESLRLDGRF